MAPKPPQPRRKDAGKGLTTLALLKVYFNRGKDHIDMLLPFVLDSLRAMKATSFEVSDIQAVVQERHGLEMPPDTLRTILVRARRGGYLRRDAGVFLASKKLATVPDLVAERLRLQGEHDSLGQELCAFAAKHGHSVATPEEALSLVLQFFEDNHFALLVADDALTSAGEDTYVVGRHGRLVAGFIRDVVLKSPPLSTCLTHMLEGFVLRNALFLRDIAVAGKGFSDLEVYLDSHIVRRLLGYEGPSQEAAARSAIELLRSAGARPAVFDGTLGEVRAILRSCEEDLRTPHRLLTRVPTPTLSHFIREGYAPADVREAISLVEHDVEQLRLPVRTFPSHEAQYTLDEAALAAMMLKPGQTSPDLRVVHDVNCVAGVLTLRRGRIEASLERAHVVFTTTTNLVVRNGTTWYRAQGGQGTSPVVHFGGLISLAWLKRPAAAATSRMDQLVAACEAALQPSKQLWEAFLNELRDLEKSGRYSSNECVAIVAHELVEARLAEVEMPEDDDARDVAEVIQRARSSIRAEADAVVEEARRKHAAETAATSESHLAALREKESRAAAAERTVGSISEENRRLRLTLQARAQRLAGIAAMSLSIMLALPFAVGAVLSLPDALLLVPPPWRVLGWGTLAVYIVLSILAMCTQYSLPNHYRVLRSRLSTRVLAWLSE